MIDFATMPRNHALTMRDGQPLTFIAYVPDARKHQRVIAMTPDGIIQHRHDNGRVFKGQDHDKDIVG